MEKLLNKKNIAFFLSGLILLLGLITRFYLLGSIPSSMNRDEPAIGYNAYSIFKTGKDEWGKKLPLTYKSFGDYKSPFYIYLTIIPIIIFGLSEFSVRFVGALAGFLLITSTYFICNKLFKEKNKIYALSTSFVMAIGSWQIFYSRFSFEANLALFLNSLVILFLIKDNFKSINTWIILLIPLSMLTYSSSLIIWPIFVIFWSIYFLIILKKNFLNKKIVKLDLLKLAILIIVIFITFYNQIAISGQKGKVTIFGNTQLKLNFNEQRLKIANTNIWKARLFYNQYIYYAKILAQNYFKNFSYNFLFGGGGGHPWHKTPGVPHFYPIFAFLALIGLIIFIKTKKIKTNTKFFIILILFISAIPSAITIDNPHATRDLNLFLLITIFSGIGLGFLINKLKTLGIIAILILLINFFHFNLNYFIKYRKFPPAELLPGIKQTIYKLNDLNIKADRKMFDSHDDGAYIYYAFFSQYPPEKFFQTIKRYKPDTVGFEWVEQLGEYTFISNLKPDYDYQELYILKGGVSLTKDVMFKVVNEYNNQIYYTGEKNF